MYIYIHIQVLYTDVYTDIYIELRREDVLCIMEENVIYIQALNTDVYTDIYIYVLNTDVYTDIYRAPPRGRALYYGGECHI